MDRAEDLRQLYDSLWEKYRAADGNSAAQLAAQLRLLSSELEQLEPSKEVAFVDELASKRAGSGSSRPPSRRRKSG